MSHRTLIALAAATLLGVGLTASVSTDALARGGRGAARANVGVHHGAAAVRPGGVAVRRGVAVGAGAAAVHGAYCGYPPYPPCY